MRFIDLSGQSFGCLRVIDRAPNKGGRTAWNCECRCGKNFVVMSCNVKKGHSCGCHRDSVNRKRLTTHGKRHTPEYKVWCDLIERCENPNNPRYRNYGDRGIKVSERWRESFQNFYEDMGPRPSAKHSIDRIDNDQDYKPDNCRWATNKQQSRNRTDSRLLTANGRTQNLKDWANELGCSHATIIARINRGWSVERAVTTPPDKRRGRKAVI